MDTCPACGAALAPDATTCPHCGYVMPDANPPRIFQETPSGPPIPLSPTPSGGIRRSYGGGGLPVSPPAPPVPPARPVFSPPLARPGVTPPTGSATLPYGASRAVWVTVGVVALAYYAAGPVSYITNMFNVPVVAAIAFWVALILLQRFQVWYVALVSVGVAIVGTLIITLIWGKLFLERTGVLPDRPASSWIGLFGYAAVMMGLIGFAGALLFARWTGMGPAPTRGAITGQLVVAGLAGLGALLLPLVFAPALFAQRLASYTLLIGYLYLVDALAPIILAATAANSVYRAQRRRHAAAQGYPRGVRAPVVSLADGRWATLSACTGVALLAFLMPNPAFIVNYFADISAQFWFFFPNALNFVAYNGALQSQNHYRVSLPAGMGEWMLPAVIMLLVAVGAQITFTILAERVEEPGDVRRGLALLSALAGVLGGVALAIVFGVLVKASVTNDWPGWETSITPFAVFVNISFVLGTLVPAIVLLVAACVALNVAVRPKTTP